MCILHGPMCEFNEVIQGDPQVETSTCFVSCRQDDSPFSELLSFNIVWRAERSESVVWSRSGLLGDSVLLIF